MQKIILSYLLMMLFHVPSCEKKWNKNTCFDVVLLVQEDFNLAVIYQNNKETGDVFKNLHITTSENDTGINGYFRLFNLDINNEVKVSSQYSLIFDPAIYGLEKIAKGQSKTYIMSNPYERIMKKGVQYKLVYYPKGLEFCQDSVSVVFTY